MSMRGVVAISALMIVSGRAWAEGEAGSAQPQPAGAAGSTGAALPGAPPIPSGGHGTPTPPLGGAAAAPPSGTSGQLGGSVLFEQIDSDYFLTLDLYDETRIGPVSFGVWVPLRFRVYDADPQNDGVIREEDWDEVSDYGRLLRFVELNLTRETWRLRARLGALDGESLGHGTVIAGYYNTVDRDHYQAGLVLNTAIRHGGVELMLDNILRPEIFGTRVHVRPAAFFRRFRDNAWANRLVAGISYSADARAPVALAPAAAPSQPAVDEQGNFQLTGRSHLGVLGFDLEYALLQTQLIDLVPYLDVNLMFDHGTGAGMHLGTFFNLRLPLPLTPTLLTRFEYRVVGSGYAPRYFDSLYEAQRMQYDPGVFRDAAGLPLTKLGWLRSADPGLNGWLGELYFDLGGWVRVGGTYEDYQGPDNSALTLSLLLPKLELVQVGAYYSRRGFDTLKEAFDPDNALLLCFARVKAYGPLFVSATYTRTWHVQPDGSYLAEGDWNVGAGVAFSY